MIETFKYAFDYISPIMKKMWKYEVPFSGDKTITIGEIIILGSIIGLLLGLVFGFIGIRRGSDKNE